MPIPVGTRIEVIAWESVGIEGVDVRSILIQKAASSEGPFFDLITIDAVDSDGNFVTMYQDNLSEDTFYYRVAFIDSKGKQSVFTDSGTAGMFNTRQALLNQLRLRLGDDDPSRHQLDNNIMFSWDRLKISSFLDQAIMAFNASAPTQTGFKLDTAPDDVNNIILTFAEAYCLRERSRIELKNKMTYSDGISLTIDRTQYDAMADKTQEQAKKDTREWKSINRSRARGLAPQRLPFKVLRPLSFGPNAANLFST